MGRFVTGSIALGTLSPAQFVDVSCDSLVKTDMDDYMGSKGFVYVSTAPTTTPAQAASGSEANKRLLENFIDAPAEGWPSGVYREATGTLYPSAITWWTSSAKTTKIVEKLITWTGVTPTAVQWKLYDSTGTTVLSTITDTIAYSGVFETSRTRTIA